MFNIGMTTSILLVLFGIFLLAVAFAFKYFETRNAINLYTAEKVLKTIGIVFIVIGVIVFAMTLAVGRNW